MGKCPTLPSSAQELVKLSPGMRFLRQDILVNRRGSPFILACLGVPSPLGRRSCSPRDPRIVILVFFVSKLSALSGLCLLGLGHFLLKLARASRYEFGERLPRIDRIVKTTESGSVAPQFQDSWKIRLL